MKVNKRIIFASIIMIFICGVLLVITKENIFWSGIFTGLMTGAIVSLVTSSINYFYEKEKILGTIKTVIPNIYLNLKLIKDMTGNMLPQIPNTSQLDSLNYRRILSLSELNMDFVQKCGLDLYSAIIKRGEQAILLSDFIVFCDKLYNLKDCIGKVELLALDVDLLQNQQYIKLQNGQIISNEERQLLSTKRYEFIVRSSKIHEYESSILIELDKIAEKFFTGKKISWNQRKSLITQQADHMLKDVSF